MIVEFESRFSQVYPIDELEELVTEAFLSGVQETPEGNFMLGVNIIDEDSFTVTGK